jgi:hypothetical protein
VVANWLIGREIVEDEQKGQRKAGYGEALLERLAGLLAADFGSGYSETNLRWFRQFYLEYQSLLPREIHHALRDKSIPGSAWPLILQTPRGRSWKLVLETATAKSLCEPKSAADMQDSEVLAKANAAAEWCKLATEHARKHGGKS